MILLNINSGGLSSPPLNEDLNELIENTHDNKAGYE